MVKTLQSKTGDDIMKCRLTLLDCNWNLELAEEKLIGHKTSNYKDEKMFSTIHIQSDGKVGIMIELECESERATKTQEFNDFVQDLFVQILTLKPEFVSPEDAPWDSSEDTNFDDSKYLLLQQSIKDPNCLIEGLLSELSEKLGETCYIKRFVRWEIDQENKDKIETKQENTKRYLVTGAVLVLLGIIGSLIMMVSL